MSYDWVGQEVFDEELEALLDEQGANLLLAVPGAYEIFAEHFNNDVLERLEGLRKIERGKDVDD